MVARKKGARSAIHRQVLHHLKMLCASGAGLGAIAGPACVAARRLVDGDNGAIFWLDGRGEAAGFYHETARVDLKDLFITRFDEMFSESHGYTMMEVLRSDGPSIGRALDPAWLAQAWQGNVHKFLCVPLDHHFFIDMRIDAGGAGRACLLVWHKGERRFTAADAEALRPAQALLSRAIAEERPDARWIALGSGNAHFITDMAGRQLLAIDTEAEALLMRSHLLSQNVPMLSKPRNAPAFALILAAMLAAGAPAQQAMAIANGRIVARARPTQMLSGQGGEVTNMFVSLSHEVSFDVLCIEHLAAQPLSPLQRELALFAMQGGERSECAARFGVSAEALKKHSARIFDVLGAAKWLDLPQVAESIAEGAARA